MTTWIMRRSGSTMAQFESKASLKTIRDHLVKEIDEALAAAGEDDLICNQCYQIQTAAETKERERRLFNVDRSRVCYCDYD